MRRWSGVETWAVATVLLVTNATGCSTSEDTADAPDQPDASGKADAAVVADSMPAGTALSPESGYDTEPEATSSSVGWVQADDTVYELEVDCYAPDTGDVLVVGAGPDPDSGGLVEVYIQAYPDAPYIGMRVGNGDLIESSFDGPLDIYLQDDVIQASAIHFVSDLDLETGQGVAAGLGELQIHCGHYETRLPQ